MLVASPLQVKAYQHLREMIEKEELVDNVIYSETKMAVTLGVSRTPMRDALQRLEQEGFIEILPSRGFQLQAITPERIHKNNQVRSALVGYSVLTFAEVKIADGSQFRRFLADGRYGADTQYKTTEMAQTVNAVLASSGDFYKFHYNGVVVYENQVRKVHANKADTCFIDAGGNLIFLPQDQEMTEEEAQRFVEENNIRFSLVFGPILVEDGVRCEPQYYDLGEINSFSPRAALCQLDELHYLVVTANPEPDHPGALNIHQFAERIAQTGCQKAYTLDGGQTAAIALDGELVNYVLYGQQRPISDIIYFATSVGG